MVPREPYKTWEALSRVTRYCTIKDHQLLLDVVDNRLHEWPRAGCVSFLAHFYCCKSARIETSNRFRFQSGVADDVVQCCIMQQARKKAMPRPPKSMVRFKVTPTVTRSWLGQRTNWPCWNTMGRMIFLVLPCYRTHPEQLWTCWNALSISSGFANGL